jgi:hypothetical protein
MKYIEAKYDKELKLMQFSRLEYLIYFIPRFKIFALNLPFGFPFTEKYIIWRM